MKVKVDLSEVRLKELTAELLKKNDESLRLKVMEAIASVQSGNLIFPSPYGLFFIPTG